jgi:hypothetical protein
MRRILTFVALLCILLAVAACKTTSSFFAARLQDCSPSHITPRHNFGSNDTPAIVYLHYNGQAVTVHIYNLATGELAWKTTDYVPKYHTTRWWNLSELPEGSYKAELLTAGNVRRTCNFTVARKPPSPPS